MAERISYVYRIDFEDGSWYWGVRLCPENTSPSEDGYSGSPVTHREKWEKDKFKKTVVKEFVDFGEASEYEVEMIKKDWQEKLCLNENCGGVISRSSCSKGGLASAEKSRGVSRTEEVKAKISEAHKGKKLSKTHIEKLKSAKRPPRSKDAIRKQIQARKNSDRPWHSEETREKMSSAAKGRVQSEKAKETLSKRLIGRKWFNNGEKQAQLHSCPEGWRPGRIRRSR